MGVGKKLTLVVVAELPEFFRGGSRTRAAAVAATASIDEPLLLAVVDCDPILVSEHITHSVRSRKISLTPQHPPLLYQGLYCLNVNVSSVGPTTHIPTTVAGVTASKAIATSEPIPNAKSVAVTLTATATASTATIDEPLLFAVVDRHAILSRQLGGGEGGCGWEGGG